MSIIQSTSTSTSSIDPTTQAKQEKAQRKAERAARRLAKAEKAQLKASSSTSTPVLPTPATTTTSSTTTSTMPPTTPTKKEKKRKASSLDDDPTTITTTTPIPNPTDPSTPAPAPAPTSKRQKSKKSKSAAKQLGPLPTTAEDEPKGESTTSPGDQQAEDGATVDKVDEAEAEAEDEDEGVIPTTPEEDKKLDEQAKKALTYAQTYAQNKQDPTIVWKFNKAKQNWLVRNIWSAELIPGRWVELVIGYLKTMQGIAQKNLVAEAKRHLATSIIAPLNTDDAPSTAETTAQSPAAPSSDPIAESTADDGEEKNEEAEIVVEDARTKEVKDRARRILTAVGIDCWSV